MSARATEVAAIEALLLEEHENSAALAKAIIEKLDAHRADRIDYCVMVWAGQHVRVYGVWAGRKSAYNDVQAGKVPIIEGEQAIVVPFIGLARVAKMRAKADEPAKTGKVENVVGKRLRPQGKVWQENVSEIHVLDRRKMEFKPVYQERGRR